jgi:hypothetical protein
MKVATEFDNKDKRDAKLKNQANRFFSLHAEGYKIAVKSPNFKDFNDFNYKVFNIIINSSNEGKTLRKTIKLTFLLCAYEFLRKIVSL